ncbi:MAG: ECF transporter S component, partial [Chloroflexota bacterium]
IRKPGASVATGLLKGSVELLSGNTHGVIILLVDLVAGLVIDIVFLIFQNRSSLWINIVAAGLASASNVFVFQIFATLPSDSLAYGAVLLLALVAFASGVIFAALLGKTLLAALNKAGVIKEPVYTKKNKEIFLLAFVCIVLISIVITIFLRINLQGPATITISGAVEHTLTFPDKALEIEQVTTKASMQDVSSTYTGYPLIDLVQSAVPYQNAAYILIKAVDGYTFFISFDELNTNDAILLTPQGKGKALSFDVVGPESSKAWIRGVKEILVIAKAPLIISGAIAEKYEFNPDFWQANMDSTKLDIGEGSQKYQGVQLQLVLRSLRLLPEAEQVIIQSDDSNLSFSLNEVLSDDSLRIFVIIGETDFTYALATMDGEVHMYPIQWINIQ